MLYVFESLIEPFRNYQHLNGKMPSAVPTRAAVIGLESDEVKSKVKRFNSTVTCWVLHTESMSLGMSHKYVRGDTYARICISKCLYNSDKYVHYENY
jgi:hypothetical protein